MPNRTHRGSYVSLHGLVGGIVLVALAVGAPFQRTHADEPRPPARRGGAVDVRLPASTLAPTVAPDEAAPDAHASLETPVPTEWQPMLMRCRRYHRKRYCEGPRRIPVPFGSAGERAERLGLGGRNGAARVKDHAPPAEWLAEVEGESHESLVFPVDEGRQGRGLSRARRRHPAHEGVDILANVGARVRSVEDGLVVYADNELRGYGNVLLVLHRDGTVALYAHLRAAYVFAGQSVRQGQLIGEVGETGLARGSHLHFELRRDGRPTNPIPRFVRLSGEVGPTVTSAPAPTSQAPFTRRA